MSIISLRARSMERIISSSFKWMARASRFLGVLDQKHHKEGDDCGRSIYHQLPGIGIVERGTQSRPANYEKDCEKECPRYQPRRKPLRQGCEKDLQDRAALEFAVDLAFSLSIRYPPSHLLMQSEGKAFIPGNSKCLAGGIARLGSFRLSRAHLLTCCGGNRQDQREVSGGLVRELCIRERSRGGSRPLSLNGSAWNQLTSFAASS
jgi:hypothetical protein